MVHGGPLEPMEEYLLDTHSVIEFERVPCTPKPTRQEMGAAGLPVSLDRRQDSDT